MTSPIIHSLLDTDLYKFTMMQCVFDHFKDATVAYRFQCRKPVDLTVLKGILEKELDALCDLTLTQTELDYLGNLPYFKPHFLDYLKNFQLSPSHVQFDYTNNLSITIQGPWVNTILYEVPLLAIVSEAYYRHQYPHHDLSIGRSRLENKVQFIKNHPDCQGLHFSDFGTRRRYSQNWQQEVVETFKYQLPYHFIGTSNVHLARLLHLKPIGTMAHEFLQAAQVLAPDLKHFQHFALSIWLEEFQGQLGIALTDVLGMDPFLADFDKTLAEAYQGLRQDSGDPFEWGEKALAHYAKLGINAKDKMLVFSDSLTLPKACDIYHRFRDHANLSFGIGTNLTNDVGLSPLDMVIKLYQTNSKPAIKISDSPGKIVCDDPHYLQHIKDTFQIRETT